MSYDIDRLDIEKIKSQPRQKFNLKELNLDLTLPYNSNTISNKIRKSKCFNENSKVKAIKNIDNIKLQGPIDLEKIMDKTFKLKSTKGEKLKPIIYVRKIISVDERPSQTKKSKRRTPIYLSKEILKNDNKIINESINQKNILPDFLKENDKVDNLKNMAKFIGEEVSIQDQKLNDLIYKYDNAFSLQEKVEIAN